MKELKIKLLFLCIVSFVSCSAQNSTIWQIGKSDNSSAEFTLANGEYSKFLEKDFGWEDRFYVVGYSNEKKDFPFVLPGAIDYWGGTSGLAGIRPHEINILFGISKKPKKGHWELVIDVLDCNPETPPYFKVTVNGKFWKFRLDKGVNSEALKGINEGTKEQKIVIPIDSELIKNGGNQIQLTTLEGSWMVFDQVRLEGPKKVTLLQPKKSIYKKRASCRLSG